MNKEELIKMRKRHNAEILSLLSEGDLKMFKSICDKTFDPYRPAKPFTYEDFRDDVMSYGGSFEPNMQMFKDMGLLTEWTRGEYCINGDFREAIREKLYGNI